MTRQYKKPKTDADRFDPSTTAQAFLDAVHGFNTTKENSNKSTAFGKLVTKAIEAGFTNTHIARNQYGINTKAAKKVRNTGVSSENRDRFIADMSAKAEDVIG